MPSRAHVRLMGTACSAPSSVTLDMVPSGLISQASSLCPHKLQPEQEADGRAILDHPALRPVAAALSPLFSGYPALMGRAAHLPNGSQGTAHPPGVLWLLNGNFCSHVCGPRTHGSLGSDLRDLRGNDLRDFARCVPGFVLPLDRSPGGSA